MENTKLASRGKTRIERMVVLEFVDNELQVTSSRDLDVEQIAGMLQTALQMMLFMLDDLDTGDKQVLQ
jgi:hypothetical protein